MYGDKYFKRRVAKYHAQEVRLARALYHLWKPETVYDAGCAIGSYLLGFHECGCEVWGSDAHAEAAWPYIPTEVRSRIGVNDMAKPWCKGRLGKRFDLVLCIEVAEHLPREGSENLCANLRGLVHPEGWLLFTAAQPGQRGKGHINCRPRECWYNMMNAAGLAYNVAETQLAVSLFRTLKDPLTLCKNLMVFT